MKRLMVPVLSSSNIKIKMWVTHKLSQVLNRRSLRSRSASSVCNGESGPSVQRKMPYVTTVTKTSLTKASPHKILHVTQFLAVKAACFRCNTVNINSNRMHRCSVQLRHLLKHTVRKGCLKLRMRTHSANMTVPGTRPLWDALGMYSNPRISTRIGPHAPEMVDAGCFHKTPCLILFV